MTLRPRSFDDEAAQEAATDHLLREFVALTDLPPTGVASGASVASTAAAPEPAVLVAASNADPQTIAVAHFLCDGTADDVEIQAAIDSLAAKTAGGVTGTARGTVVLSEGIFELDGTVTVSEGCRLIGHGLGTILYDAGSQNMEITMSDNSEIGWLSFSD